MKKLNAVILNDLFNPCGFKANYKGFTALYCNGYITVYKNEKTITSFTCSGKNIKDIKKTIKDRINAMNGGNKDA